MVWAAMLGEISIPNPNLGDGKTMYTSTSVAQIDNIYGLAF